MTQPGLSQGGAETRPWVLLDRDGTLNVECHYLNDPARLELLPGVLPALARLQARGVGLAVVTNQSGLARGLITPTQLRAIHDRLGDWLRQAGVELAGIYVCPHGPDDHCGCRKPAPGLAWQAARDWGIDLSRAWVVGDKRADLELATAIGARGILVRTGYGRETEQSLDPASRASAIVVEHLEAAADAILAALDSPPPAPPSPQAAPLPQSPPPLPSPRLA
ncbi:MAG: D-glycero-alpha-D-manno-heptose-1,7-bisphosphate 7-phosphatase [Planctomycetaceae bacterium]